MTEKGAMARYEPKLDLDDIVEIDIHTHAEVSGRQPRDPCSILFDEQMAKYFKSAARPGIAEVAQYYRERVLFGTDYPVLAPDRWIADFAKLPIKDEVRPLIMRENAIRLLKLRR